MRSAESVAFTIVEGCGAATANEFARFLDMSIKSLSELEEQLQLGRDYGIITESDWRSNTEQVRIIRKMTWSLRRQVLGNDPSRSRKDDTTETRTPENRKRNATENDHTRCSPEPTAPD
jgi:four helix bundle protein